MKITKVLIGAIVGTFLFLSGAVIIGAQASSISSVIYGSQPRCGGICGTNHYCTNSACPRCTMDKNYAWSCTG
jgi:hypothetical protein